MRKIFRLIICLTVLLTAGCASKWMMAVESPGNPARWLDDTNTSGAVYLGSIRGFNEIGTTIPTVLKYVVFGRRAEDNTIVRPVAVAVGPDKRLAIADLGRSCVHLYVPSEGKYRKLFGAGQEDFRTPVGVAFDDEARLYVSDSTKGVVHVFDPAGEHLFSIRNAAANSLLRPTGLAFHSGRKTLYVVDTMANRVYAYTTAGNLLFGFGKPGENAGQLNFPTHIVVAPKGRLYVVDAMNFRVQVFDSSGSYLSSFGHHGNGSGDFAMPKGIAVDKAGVVYVVDTLFDNVQLFNTAGGFLLTLGSRGTGEGEFSMPSGMYLDNQDKLYVCDTYNQRVQIFQVMGNPR